MVVKLQYEYINAFPDIAHIPYANYDPEDIFLEFAGVDKIGPIKFKDGTIYEGQ